MLPGNILHELEMFELMFVVFLWGLAFDFELSFVNVDFNFGLWLVYYEFGVEFDSVLEVLI